MAAPGWRIAVTLACLGLPSATAGAKTQAVVRVTAGDHPYSGRLVLDAAGLPHSISREGNRVLIRLPDDAALGALPPAPRNVLSMRAVPGGVELTVPPGATVHDTRMGNRIVVDVDDAGTAPRPAPARANPTAPDPAADLARPAPGAPERNAAPNHAPVPEAKRSAPAQKAKAVLTPEPDRGAASLPPDRTVKKPEPAQGPALPGGPPSPPSGPPPSSVTPLGAQTEGTPSEPGPAVSAAAATAPPMAGEPLQPRPASGERKRDPDSDAVADAGPPRDTPTLPGMEPTQVWPVTRDALPVGPVALVANKGRPPGGLNGTAIQVPFADPVGAALFSRGSDAYVVFDERRPIDLGALKDDPVFGSAVVTIYPGATVIHVVLPHGQSAMLSRAPSGWRVSVVAVSPKPAPLIPVAAAGTLTFAADSPGQVVAITDPATGGTLMVGTQRKPGQGVLTERHMPEFALLVTGQGLVVDPLADSIGLRTVKTGFALTGPRSGLAISAALPMEGAMLDAARLTRRFGFPGQATDALMWRAKQQAVAAATSQPLARGPKRRALAETMLGLGLAAEAQTLLRITAKDDPREAAVPETEGLMAIAALLAGRPGEANDLADPRLTGTDEVALWRALQIAMAEEGSPRAASVLATVAPLLFTYPEEMRRRVLPLAMETMVLGGEAEAAARLLAQRETDPGLAFARALLKQAKGDNEAALKLFDDLANARSPYEHARAAVRAVELRLAMGKLDAKAAADALDKLLYAWRGDGRDLALRRRIAELRQKEGAWRMVFAGLRAAKADFPGQAADIDRQLKEAFAALPRDPSVNTMPPPELIALLEENAELLADGPEGEPMRIRLAEKLMALDLPKRADAVLTRLMRASPIGPARAGFGATLATLRLREGNADGAMLALAESSSADMPDPVRERRALIAARVDAKRGDVGGAVETLSGLRTSEADEARASILEQAKDWAGARDALSQLVARSLPGTGALDDQGRRLVLRLATAAARASDDAALAALREKMLRRIGTGPQADMFRLLTAEPVRGTADLGRARAEMGLARAVAADMNPRKGPAKPP